MCIARFARTCNPVIVIYNSCDTEHLHLDLRNPLHFTIIYIFHAVQIFCLRFFKFAGVPKHSSYKVSNTLVIIIIIVVFVKLVEYIDVWVYDLTRSSYYTRMCDLTSDKTDTPQWYSNNCS